MEIQVFLTEYGIPEPVLRQRLTNIEYPLKYFTAFAPKWRNWQTRYVQGVVGITPVRVQIPPSAHKKHTQRVCFFCVCACPFLRLQEENTTWIDQDFLAGGKLEVKYEGEEEISARFVALTEDEHNELLGKWLLKLNEQE